MQTEASWVCSAGEPSWQDAKYVGGARSDEGQEIEEQGGWRVKKGGWRMEDGR